MTKITSVEKESLLTLSGDLKSELITLGAEVGTIKGNLSSVQNYDGMNFSGAASIISQNLVNVTTALENLSTNVQSYIQEVEKFDVYEGPVEDAPGEEIIPPELDIPTTNPGTGVETTPEDKEQKENQETEPENNNKDNQETEPENNNKDDQETRPENNNKDNQETEPENNNKDDQETEPENNNQENQETRPENTSKPNNSETISQSQGNLDNGSSNSTPSNEPDVYVPQEQKASESISYAVGNPNIDVSKYTDNPELGYTVTTGNLAYQLGTEDYNLLCAIVAAESDGTYDGTLAIMSTILNRCETGDWKIQYGMDPIAQITATNQFSSYTSGEYQSYIGNISSIVHEAINDGLAGVRNHSLC